MRAEDTLLMERNPYALQLPAWVKGHHSWWQRTSTCIFMRWKWPGQTLRNIWHNSLPITQASLQPIPCNQLRDTLPTLKHPEWFHVLPTVFHFSCSVTYQPFDFHKEIICIQGLLNSRHHKAPCMHWSYWFFIRTLWYKHIFYCSTEEETRTASHVARKLQPLLWPQSTCSSPLYHTLS